MRLSTTGEVFIANVSSCRDDDGGAIGLPCVDHSEDVNYSTWEEDTPLRSVSDGWRSSPLLRYLLVRCTSCYSLSWSISEEGSMAVVFGVRKRSSPQTNTYVFENAFGFG